MQRANLGHVWLPVIALLMMVIGYRLVAYAFLLRMKKHWKWFVSVFLQWHKCYLMAKLEGEIIFFNKSCKKILNKNLIIIFYTLSLLHLEQWQEFYINKWLYDTLHTFNSNFIVCSKKHIGFKNNKKKILLIITAQNKFHWIDDTWWHISICPENLISSNSSNCFNDKPHIIFEPHGKQTENDPAHETPKEIWH